MKNRILLLPLIAAIALLSLPAAANSWQMPTNYSRTPSGANPSNPITFSADFTDESGCPNQTYSFWLFAANGTPLGSVGTSVTLQGSGVSQTVSLADGVDVDAIRLACTDSNGDRYDSSSNLEAGSPAFTPFDLPPSTNWQTPANYVRTSSGIHPVNPVTLSVSFTDETGCSNQTYRFWIYEGNGTPLTGIGSNTTLQDSQVTQTASLADGVDIEAIRLVCTDSNGDLVDSTDDLEAGSPAFTPYDQLVSSHWQSPVHYSRTPSGANPSNPITFSADFTDESGCPNQTYSFWLFAANGTPLGSVGTSVTLQGSGVSQTVSLADGVDVDAIRLACTDSNGDRYDSSSNLEAGSPAFTPFDP